MSKGKYNIGDHITTENGKLKIKNDKKRLIKLAKQEIKEWQGIVDNGKKEIAEWEKFISELKNKRR